MDPEELELELIAAITGKKLDVRNDCAFCGWERSAKDDNHAPSCAYWTFFGDREESR